MMKKDQPKRLLVLIVEDSASRYQMFAAMFPDFIRPVWVKSAGVAIGTLKRDRDTYCGIMLDHDLTERVATDADRFMTGMDVAKVIAETHNKKRPLILIHSMNIQGARMMYAYLTEKQFEVERVPTAALTRERLLQWLEEVRGGD